MAERFASGPAAKFRTAYERGIVAGNVVLARGVPRSAMIRGVFKPGRGQESARDPWGTFQVMRGSMCESEQQMPHSEVQDFWRGFVVAFES